MALSQIKINEAVQLHTNAAIREANYLVLRQYLLERKPLLIVTTKINELLSQHCDSDKQLFMNSATQKTCADQRNSDIQEAIIDEQERSSDILLRSTYSSELHVLESNLNQLDTQCFLKQQRYNQVSSQLSELQIQLAQINSSIDIVRQNRRLLNTRYALNTPFPQDTIHIHPAGTVHVHSNGLQFPPYYPDRFSIFSLQDQLAWDRLSREENRLLAEQQSLNSLVASTNSESRREERDLNKLNQEKAETVRRSSDLKQQLNSELPNREQQRQLKHQERIVREQARITEDPNLQQLSYKNRTALKQLIANKNNELDRKQKQLMEVAIETSYSTYLRELERAFNQKGGLVINFSESEALKTSLNLMQTYLKMAEYEQKLVTSLNGEQNNLHLLQSQFSQHQSQLQQYIASEPQLLQENKDLGTANDQLNLDSESARTVRNSALYTSLFGVCGGLSGAGYLLTSFVISPVLIAIPAAFALITLIALTVAVVYYFKHSASDEQIKQNTQTIEDNNATILQQTEKAGDLNRITIPSLNLQIEEKTKSISEIEQRLSAFRESMRQQFGKAENVTTTLGGSNSFFGGYGDAAPTVQPAPSAPTEHPETADGRYYPELFENPPSYHDSEGYQPYVPTQA